MAPGSPTLPRELEREIFELCALSRPAFIPKLMLVAQRVKECKLPIFLSSLTTLYLPFVGPPTFFHTVVRYLILFPSSDMKAMLTLCTNVEDLWLYDLKPALIPLIGALPLKRLRVSAARMPLPPSRIFSHLTHLHLGGNRNSAEDTCAFIASLPKLTHLSMGTDASVPTSHKIFESLPSIRVLVFFEHYRRVWSADKAAVGELPQDVRFVVMRPRDKIDWYAGIQRGTDYWSDAENLCRKAQKGGARFAELFLGAAIMRSHVDLAALLCQWPFHLIL
ncbi:hypothetical protein B0H14DRAFT_3461014 [Mycena olivaceomarginata]|nr:hypothetical protein B0H14DRAFT_3461014 [Mycena olivaceomarginata]